MSKKILKKLFLLYFIYYKLFYSTQLRFAIKNEKTTFNILT